MNGKIITGKPYSEILSLDALSKALYYVTGNAFIGAQALIQFCAAELHSISANQDGKTHIGSISIDIHQIVQK
jgi:hypothetical protein